MEARIRSAMPGWSAFAVAVVLVGACAGTSPTAGWSPLSMEALRNADYASGFPAGGRAILINGLYREGRASGPPTELTVRLDESYYAFGDLDGDGSEDAAVILSANQGGSGAFLDLAAVVNRGGVPLHAASLRLGDRVRIESLSIERGKISLRLVRHAPEDPLCCPTLPVEERYLLKGGSLVPSR